MFKKFSIVVGLAVVFTLLLTSTVVAAKTKYTFEDVTIDEQILEIEASVKQTKKGAYSTCSYFSDDYIEHLGLYEEAVSADDTADEILEFCIANFEQVSP